MRKQKECNINNSLFTEYFPIDKLVDNTLSLFQDFLSLKFNKIYDNLYNKDVPLYEVKDKDSSNLMGYF